MNDEQIVRSALRDAGTPPTDEFRARLRSRLEGELRGEALLDPVVAGAGPRSGTGSRRTWWWLGSAAAMMAVLVGVVVLRSPEWPSTTLPVTPSSSTPASTAVPQTTVAPPVDPVAAVIGNTWVLVDAGERAIPSPVPTLAPLPPGADGLFGVFDGCNGGSVFGSIDPVSGRMVVTGGAFTDMACPGIETLTLPTTSDLRLMDDTGPLVVNDATVDQGPLTFRRIDSLGAPVQRDQLIGVWASEGDRFAVTFDADGQLHLGACTLTWALSDDSVLGVSGRPASYDETCVPRLLGPLSAEPYRAQIDDSGVLWLTADPATVLRLEPSEVPPAPPPSTPITMVVVAPALVPIEHLAPCQPDACPTVTVAPDGTIVSYDDTTHTIVVGQRGSAPPRSVEVAGAPPVVGYLVTVGPDDVAYLVVQPVGVVDPIGDLIAVPLSGASAGSVVASAPGVVNLSGDSSLVSTRTGLVSVGCCGFDTVTPDPARAPLLGWVDRSGASVTLDGPVVSMERTDETVSLVSTDADGTRATWAVPADEVFGMQGMPDARMPADRSLLVTWWDVPNGGHRLLRLLADGGVEEIVVQPTMPVVALSPFGQAVIYDGSRFQLWQLPAFTTFTDATADVVDSVGQGPFESPDAIVDQLLQALIRPNGCDVFPTATVVDRTVGPGSVAFTVAARSGCDENLGADYQLSVVQDADGSWRVDRALRRELCGRGASGDVCV